MYYRKKFRIKIQFCLHKIWIIWLNMDNLVVTGVVAMVSIEISQELFKPR